MKQANFVPQLNNGCSFRKQLSHVMADIMDIFAAAQESVPQVGSLGVTYVTNMSWPRFSELCVLELILY
jgi:hypothetical protein